MDKKTGKSKSRRFARRLGPFVPGKKQRPLKPSLETQERLPCAELLQVVSEIHMSNLAFAGALPLIPNAVIPGNLGAKQSLPKHEIELKSIEGYHLAKKQLNASSNSSNSLQLSFQSYDRSPLPLLKRKKVHHPRRSQEPSPYGSSLVKSGKSYPSEGSSTFITAHILKEPRTHPRAASVRPIYVSSESPIPTEMHESSPILSYIGEYLKGLKHGDGEAKYTSGDSYKGSWVSGLRDGYGEYRYQELNASFKGDWVDDLKQGSGVLTFSNGDTLECIWAKDCVNDRTGCLTYVKTGERYEGEIRGSVKVGDGEMKYRDGTVYHGQWVRDKRHGSGILYLPNCMFEGEFNRDVTSGLGLLHLKGVLFLRTDAIQPSNIAALPLEKEALLGDLTDFFHFAYSTILRSDDIIWKCLTTADLQTRLGTIVDGSSDGTFTNGVLNGASLILYGNFGLYEGMCREGRRSGYGRMTYRNKSRSCLNLPESEGVYLGRWRNDERHGLGKMQWKNGLVYEGHFVRDHRHNVKGTLRLPSGEQYDGDWKHDLMHGEGKYADGKGSVFAGEFVSGHPVRNGVLSLPDGSSFKGEVVDMKPCGTGLQTFPNGDSYTGSFLNGVRHGNGTMTYASGATYSGEWKSGLREGRGVFQSLGQTYDGLWSADRQHGPGLFTTSNNEVLSGTWTHGEASGFMNVINHHS